ncbi:hypothetical protein BC937DRAFT_89048 [Endogone sp. FLAS-F59071]|nr:hypothetical protein BC937DRAFT_89048 [Endogone sp. FLAS-F59071]|eukprot:RUS18196.1 hypothetical protein BC937DRAFT_89048 [Endogone sp. FLAS-F59071]
MDVSIRADDVIDLDTAFDGDSFLASSAGAAAFLNLSGLTINDMDQDRYHDDDDELNDELGIQPRFLDPRFGPNGGKKGKDWRRESVALFKRLNEVNINIQTETTNFLLQEMLTCRSTCFRQK